MAALEHSTKSVTTIIYNDTNATAIIIFDLSNQPVFPVTPYYPMSPKMNFGEMSGTFYRPNNVNKKLNE